MAKVKQSRERAVNSESRSVPKLVISNASEEFDTVVHERTRLAILSTLAVSKKISFTELKSQLKVSDGNLSAHARKLENAGYLDCTKGFDGRIPKTEFQITAAGRKALKRYIAHMEALIVAMKKA